MLRIARVVVFLPTYLSQVSLASATDEGDDRRYVLHVGSSGEVLPGLEVLITKQGCSVGSCCGLFEFTVFIRISVQPRIRAHLE